MLGYSWSQVYGQTQFIEPLHKTKSETLGLKIKLSERRVHCVYLNLYKSKYSTINIQFSYINFKNAHPHVQNNVGNCVHQKKKVGEGVGGEIKKYNGILSHFICKVNISMSMFTWVSDHGYHAMGMGTGTSPACQEVTSTGPRPLGMGTGTSPACQEVTGTGPRPYPRVGPTGTNFCIWAGMGKGTTSVLSWALYICN